MGVATRNGATDGIARLKTSHLRNSVAAVLTRATRSLDRSLSGGRGSRSCSGLSSVVALVTVHPTVGSGARPSDGTGFRTRSHRRDVTYATGKHRQDAVATGREPDVEAPAAGPARREGEYRMSAMTNGIAWFQIGVPDATAAKRFYGDLFGWTFTKDDDPNLQYHIVQTPAAGSIQGGIWETGGGAFNPAMFCIMVDDVAETARRAEAAEGKR